MTTVRHASTEHELFVSRTFGVHKLYIDHPARKMFLSTASPTTGPTTSPHYITSMCFTQRDSQGAAGERSAVPLLTPPTHSTKSILALHMSRIAVLLQRMSAPLEHPTKGDMPHGFILETATCSFAPQNQDLAI